MIPQLSRKRIWITFRKTSRKTLRKSRSGSISVARLLWSLDCDFWTATVSGVCVLHRSQGSKKWDKYGGLDRWKHSAMSNFSIDNNGGKISGDLERNASHLHSPLLELFLHQFHTKVIMREWLFAMTEMETYAESFPRKDISHLRKLSCYTTTLKLAYSIFI